MSKKVTENKPEKTKRIPTPAKWGIAAFILLAIAFTVFCIYMKQKTNPNRIANQYITTFMSKDTVALFDLLGFEQGPFMSPDTLEESLEECHKYSTLTTYSMVEYDTTDNENQNQYGFEYWDDGRNNPYNQTLILNKAEKPLYLLFDNWQIDTTEFVAKNCRLDAPANATVTVDGTKLTEDLAKGTKSGVTTYELGHMFIGNHEIVVSMDGFENFSTNIYLKGADYSGTSLYTITASMMKVTAETEKSLKEQAKSLIQTLYKNALETKEFAKLAKKFTFEKSMAGAMEQAYITLLANNVTSPTHLSGVEFNTFVSSASTTYAEDGCYAIAVTSEVNYTANSTVVKDASDGMNGVTSSSTQHRSTAGNSLFTTTFHYNQGSWQIHYTTALDTCIYYTKY